MITAQLCIKKYGIPYDDTATTVNENTNFERKWMKLWGVPEYINKAIPAIPNKIYCHIHLIPILEQALINVINRGLSHEIKTWDGCFNIRNKRGLGSLSIHSFALAIDLNAAWNQLGKTPTMSKELVACFTDAGLEWGGTWSRKDGMHFQVKELPL